MIVDAQESQTLSRVWIAKEQRDGVEVRTGW